MSCRGLQCLCRYLVQEYEDSLKQAFEEDSFKQVFLERVFLLESFLLSSLNLCGEAVHAYVVQAINMGHVFFPTRFYFLKAGRKAKAD